MMSSGPRAFIYGTAKVIDAVASALVIPVLIAVRWTPQTPLPPWFESFFRWVQAHGPLIGICLLAASYVCRLRKFMVHPVTGKVIHAVLTYQQKHIFQDEGEIAYEHRVTLFLMKRWAWTLRCWPWSGWLVPYERSGALTRKSRSCFRATANQPSRHEGIAGSTWAKQGRTVVVEDLPDLQDPDNPPTEAMIRDYAKRTLVSPEWVRKHLKLGKPLALSYYGHPVEINGIIVGVIVVDSRNPKVKKGPKYLNSYKLVAAMLSEVLAKGVDRDQ